MGCSSRCLLIPNRGSGMSIREEDQWISCDDHYSTVIDFFYHFIFFGTALFLILLLLSLLLLSLSLWLLLLLSLSLFYSHYHYGTLHYRRMRLHDFFFHIHDVQWTSPLFALPAGTKYTETNSCILIHVLRPIIWCNIPVPTKINPQQTSLQLNPATFKLKDPKLNSILVSFQANIFVRCITSKKPSEIFGAQSLEK